MANDPNIDLKLNLDITGVNDALYDMIGNFKGTDKQFAAIAASIDKNAKMLEASIKRFGPASKEAENASKSLQKSLTGLVAYGINPTSDAFIKLEKSLPQVSSAMDNAGNSIKKNNMQLTNLALVLQDLPFGFRGIQNNLPALLGSAAGATGGMYLAFSALIAAVTAYDMGLFSATKTNDDFNKSLKTTNEELRKAVNYTNSDTANLESLLRVGLNLNNSESVRLQALKDIKRILGDVNKEEANKITTIESAIAPIQMYTEALKKQELQETASGKIAALQAGLVEKKDALKIAEKGGARKVDILRLFGFDSIDDLRKDVIEAESQIRYLENILDQANKKTFVNPFTKGLQKSNKEDEKAARDAQRLADEAQRKKEANWAREERARMEIIAFETKLQNDLQRLEDEKLKKQERIDSITLSNAESIANALRNIKDKFLKDDLAAIDKNTKQELRLNKNSRRASIDALKKEQQTLLALKEKDIFQGVDTTPIDKKLQDNANALQVYSDTWTRTSEQINNAVESVIEGGIATFAENIGKALAGGDVNLFDGILGILAEGLSTIGKALIAYGVAMDAFKKAFANPYAAIAAGAALVVIGSFIATKVGQMAAGGASEKGGPTAFANGGIVSGPTLGLMGEYPGAKSNPEVIAPLDKLKEMIGSNNGGGSFVLRGTDLVLAMNRSETSLNLRR